MDDALDVVAEIAGDFHAPGRFEVGDAEGHLLAFDLGAGDFELVFVVVFGTVARGAFQVPDLDLEGAFCGERVTEGDGVFPFRSGRLDRHVARLSGGPDPAE